MLDERDYGSGAIFDEHVANEFVAQDVDATMRTMTAEPYVWHVPALTGAKGGEAVLRIPMVVVMGFEGTKVSYERIYWDQASVLAQIGLLEPSRLPASAAEQPSACSDWPAPRSSRTGAFPDDRGVRGLRRGKRRVLRPLARAGSCLRRAGAIDAYAAEIAHRLQGHQDI